MLWTKFDKSRSRYGNVNGEEYRSAHSTMNASASGTNAMRHYSDHHPQRGPQSGKETRGVTPSPPIAKPALQICGSNIRMRRPPTAPPPELAATIPRENRRRPRKQRISPAHCSGPFVVPRRVFHFRQTQRRIRIGIGQHHLMQQRPDTATLTPSPVGSAPRVRIGKPAIKSIALANASIRSRSAARTRSRRTARQNPEASLKSESRAAPAPSGRARRNPPASLTRTPPDAVHIPSVPTSARHQVVMTSPIWRGALPSKLAANKRCRILGQNMPDDSAELGIDSRELTRLASARMEQ